MAKYRLKSDHSVVVCAERWGNTYTVLNVPGMPSHVHSYVVSHNFFDWIFEPVSAEKPASKPDPAAPVVGAGGCISVSDDQASAYRGLVEELRSMEAVAHEKPVRVDGTSVYAEIGNGDVLLRGRSVGQLLSRAAAAIAEAGVNGISNEALLAIVEDRLLGFQSGEYACRENAVALTKIQEAMMWLQKRTRDRAARGVEGTSQK